MTTEVAPVADPCFLCRRDNGAEYVLWVLHDGRLVKVCSNCLDRYTDEDRRRDEAGIGMEDD